MTKNELVNGMLVQCRNGEWHMVLKDSTGANGSTSLFMDVLGSGHVDMDEHSEDLCEPDGQSKWDIVKVAKCNDVSYVFEGIAKGLDAEDYRGFKVIWERSNPQITEVQSLITELQEQLKAAQDKLEAIQCMA